MGALTSKPYSYNFRPWELEKFKFYDFLHSSLSLIKVEFNNNNISRILPTYDKSLNENYISNKTRFFFDFYKNQKIMTPTIKLKNNNFNSISYNKSLNLLNLNFFKLNKITFLINKNFINLTETILTKSLLNSNYNFDLIYNNNNNNYNNLNFNNFNFSILNLIKQNLLKQTFIFLNTNLRFEYPIILLKLKNFNKKTNLIKFYSISTNFNSNLKFIKNLGSNLNLTLKKLLFSKLKVKKLYSNFDNLKFFISSNSKLNYTTLAKFKNLKLSNLNNNNLFNLFSNIGEPNLNFLNLSEKITNSKSKFSTLLNFNNDNLNFNNFNFSIYFGHNAILTNLENYNLFIPIQNIFEQESNFKPFLNSKKIVNFSPIFTNSLLKPINFFLFNFLKKLKINFKLIKLNCLNFLINNNNNNINFLKNLNLSELNYNFYIDNVFTYSSKTLNLAYKIATNKKKKNELI